MTLHVRILWGLLDPKQTPANPPNEILADFATHFSTEESLLDCHDGPSLISPSLVQIGSAVSILNQGQIAAQV
jgi:hypothetical protein